MRESLLSIPISEVFEPKCGCPLCRLRDMLEARCVEYIMGAAMMEPDVRQETNRTGFCAEHYGMLLKQRNRLSLALMLETHLMELRRQLEKGKPPAPGSDGRAFGTKIHTFVKRTPGRAPKEASSCFVCEKIDWGMEHMLDTIFSLYSKEESFRRLFGEQEYFCLPHYRLLLERAGEKLPKRDPDGFIQALTAIFTRYAGQVNADVSHYCKMYDYRNSGPNADWGNSRDSIERAILFLTGRDYRKS